MTAYVNFQVLDVGQGTGNFVEVWDTNGNLTNTILNDLGSDHEKDEAGGPSAAYVVNRLKSMQPQPTIDLLVVSHSDSDHINLLTDVLKAFKPAGSPPSGDSLLIKKVYYGGAYELYAKGRRNKPSFNILDDVQKYVRSPADFSGMAPRQTSFETNPKTASLPLATVGPVQVYLVIANAASASIKPVAKKAKVSKPTAYNINSQSVVLMYEYRGGQIVAVGDATGLTLAQASRKIRDPAVRTKFFPIVIMLTMPHHGSPTTTFDLKAPRGDPDKPYEKADANVTTFSNYMMARTITASAERTTYNHPAWRVLSFFTANLQATPRYEDPALPNRQHFYTAYFRPEDGIMIVDGSSTEQFPATFSLMYSVQTAATIYTNLYVVSALQQGVVIPPNPGSKTPKINLTKVKSALGIAWTYKTTAQGDVTLTPMVNRPSTLEMRRAMLAGLPPEYLPGPVSREELAAEDARAVEWSYFARAAEAGGATTSPPPREPPAPQARLLRLQPTATSSWDPSGHVDADQQIAERLRAERPRRDGNDFSASVSPRSGRPPKVIL